MVGLPRLIISAPSTGAGKTTIATGLMAALRLAGHEVSGHKVGPDYIDPGYHALATGRPGRNLDPHLVGEDRIVPLLLHGAAGADVAVIEGVMGLYDGRIGADGFASTAHIAKLTSSPVVLVLDVARMSRSAAAIAVGMVTFDPEVDLAGVVLNRAGSARNEAEIRAALEQAGLPVLGSLPRYEDLATPSRHLGLVPAVERDGSVALVQRLGQQVAEHLDLDGLLAVARSASALDASPWDPGAEMGMDGSFRPKVAVAGGRAFTFRYPETDELLRASGCDVVTFDPLTDAALPEGTQAIYLGGGFPEVYADELAANQPLLASVRAAVQSGVPTVAECAGLLYLAESLGGAAMAGVVPASAAMTDRLALRYPQAIAVSDSLVTRSGERITGHEFHRTATDPIAGATPAWEIDGRPTGFTSGSLHASYLHVHWAGYPQLAQRFADAARAATPVRRDPATAATAATAPRPPAPSVTEQRLVEPLRHHGDAEVGVGLVDFAVNVYDGPRPGWLESALRGSLAEAHAYPDASGAAAAIAHRHHRELDEVLPTSGAAEAFALIAALRPWCNPVVVHPQFTEPQAALEQAGHQVTEVICSHADGFALHPSEIPDDADLVIIGNPTNPTGVLHRASAIRKLLKRGRLVVVDEAFMDTILGETESLVRERVRGLVVVRSLTKHWSIPGIRSGYVVGHRSVVARLADLQTPWSVSAPAIAAATACMRQEAEDESRRRAAEIGRWRGVLERGLQARQIVYAPSSTSFVLAQPGVAVHGALRERGIAVRRADTFPGLDPTWTRIAVRRPEVTARLFEALDRVGLLDRTS